MIFQSSNYIRSTSHLQLLFLICDLSFHPLENVFQISIKFWLYPNYFKVIIIFMYADIHIINGGDLFDFAWDRVSLCSSSWPGTHHMNQSGLEPTHYNPTGAACSALSPLVCATGPRLWSLLLVSFVRKLCLFQWCKAFPPLCAEILRFLFCFVLFYKGFTPLPLLGRVLSFCLTYGETPAVFSAWKKHFFLQRNPFSKNLPLAGPHLQTPVLYFRDCHRF